LEELLYSQKTERKSGGAYNGTSAASTMSAGRLLVVLLSRLLVVSLSRLLVVLLARLLMVSLSRLLVVLAGTRSTATTACTSRLVSSTGCAMAFAASTGLFLAKERVKSRYLLQYIVRHYIVY
jgi:hypothetical protein